MMSAYGGKSYVGAPKSEIRSSVFKVMTIYEEWDDGVEAM